MKFRDIFDIIKQNTPINITKSQVNNENYFIYTEKEKNKIKNILELEAFSRYREIYEKSQLKDSNVERYKGTGEISRLNGAITEINSSSKLFVDSFISIYPELNEFSFSIKLPNFKNLSELTSISKELDTIFNQVLTIPGIEDEIKIINCDTGSIWFDVAATTFCAVKLIADLTNIAFHIKNKKIECRMREEELRKMCLANDFLEKQIIIHNQLLKAISDFEIKNLIENTEFSNKVDNETRMRIENALSKLSEQIDKGLEIRPTIETSKDLKIEFPNLDYLESITSKIKQIDDKS